MALTPEQTVRLKTTPDHALLSDVEIEGFLSSNDGNVDLAIADALEHIATKQPWDRVTRGDITVEKNTVLARAEAFRRRGDLAAAQAGARQTIDIAKLERTDMGAEDAVEYA